MNITFVKNENYFLINNIILLDNDDLLLINKLKNKKSENFIFDETEKIWYYQNYKSKTPLINILYSNSKIESFTFINNNNNDYRKNNINIIYNKNFIDEFKEPSGYIILKKGTSYHITEGKFAGQYRNMYWKVKDSEDNTYYMMHIKNDIYTKISKRDIDKILLYDNIRPSWYLNNNGYISTTLRIDKDEKYVYLHQLIMDVHNEDLSSFEKTVDHINMDKLDNRQSNLRLVSMSVQNANKGKATRRSDACNLPDCIKQSDLPKYVVYRKEFMDKETDKYREYFYICNHPKLEKTWETTKSILVDIKTKLQHAKLKLQLLDGEINDNEYNIKMGIKEEPIDLPVGIRMAMDRNKLHLIFDWKNDENRYSFRSVLKSNNLQKELNDFIDNINIKYTDLKIPKYIIKNIPTINDDDISIPAKVETYEPLKLPPNMSFYQEKGKYYFGFNKIINKIRKTAKHTLATNKIQTEFDEFIKKINIKYTDLNIPNYIIPNVTNDHTKLIFV
jgi:hypothetical protein